MRQDGLIKAINLLLTIIGVAAVLYHLTMVQWQIQGSTDHKINHLFLAMTIAALAVMPDALKTWNSGKSKAKLILAVICLIGSWFAMGYFRIYAVHLEMSQPFITDRDLWVSYLAVAVLMVLAWMHWGGIIVSLTLISILYFFWGHLIPGSMGHPAYDAKFIMSYLGASMSLGMFGPIIMISANVIFLFIVFGTLFRYTGVLPLFLELGKSVGNIVRGGAAFPAVIGSAFVGTVTGAAVANVILTGSATIPTMKRTGFRAEQAAAIEAVASTGGQIMPPIMGSAAFLMAAFLDVPYLAIMKMAVIPALLYYAGAGIGVYFMIRAAGLNPPKMDVDPRLILKSLPVFVIPMTAVIWLLVEYYSPGYAAFYGIVALIAVAILQKQTRPTLSQWIEGFAEAAKVGAQLALILALVGMLAQVSVTTNLATKLSQTVIGLVGNELVPILIISAVIAIVLGMELPTAAAYVIMFVTVVPLMIDAGVNMFAANFFAFYFAILSTLTPPVALSVLAASRLAGSGFLATCQHSLRISVVGYFLPFAMVFTPQLLGFPDKVGGPGLMSIGVFVIATISGGAALYGYFFRPLGWPDRVGHIATAIVGLGYVFSPDTTTLLVFLGLAILGYARGFFANIWKGTTKEAD